MWLALLACTSAPIEGDDAGECRDGADNDQDGAFDCDDDGCAGSPDCDGKTPAPTDTGDVPTNPTDTGEPKVTNPGDEMAGYCGSGAPVVNDVNSIFGTVTLVLGAGKPPVVVPLCSFSLNINGGKAEHEGRCVTLTGAWEVADNDCPAPAVSQVWHNQATGIAYHTLKFDSSGDVLQEWTAHGDRRHGVPSDSFSDQYWITQIDDDVSQDAAASYTEFAGNADGNLTTTFQISVAP